MDYVVIGAGKSGIAAAILAKKKGHNVFVTESKTIEKMKDSADILSNAGIEAEFGNNSENVFKKGEIFITSPGVLPNTWILSEADKRSVPVISEVEFAYQFLNNPIIAITGTNGKTTTTTLTAYILNKSGQQAVTTGNIGNPISDLVDNISNETIIVAELSSFQLDRISTFKPNVAAILNISPDHLYYHGNMEKYIKAKFKICMNQNEKDLLILNNDDQLIINGISQARGEIAYFSMNPMQQGIYKKGEKMCLRLPDSSNEEEIMSFDEIRLPGIHNAYNSMAAVLAARCFEISNENIRDSLMAFEGVEHRLEFVRSIDGTDYINDSKATNINATWYALSSYKQPIIWIAGGRGDSNDYSSLDELVKKQVKCIIAIGEEEEAIFNHYCSFTRCIRAGTSLMNAVNRAKNEASVGDIVLFTPACKSFDMFMNYEHRGEVFKEIVNNL